MQEFRSLEDLLDLQTIDSEIDRLLHRRQNLAELESYREASETLQGIEREIEEVGVRVRQADLASDKADGELRMAEDKLQREEQRLFAGGLSARDAEHLRQEVEMLRRQASERETEILTEMDRKDAADKEMVLLVERRTEAQAVKDDLEKVIVAAWKDIDGDIARQEERKQDVVALIEPDLMALYEELRPIKEGVAVGRLADGTCGGCHLKLSAAEEAQVRRGTPPRCLHCRRILVPQ